MKESMQPWAYITYHFKFVLYRDLSLFSLKAFD